MATNSDVWGFLTRNEDKATCHLCGKELAYCCGTSNLRDHFNPKENILAVGEIACPNTGHRGLTPALAQSMKFCHGWNVFW